MFSETTQRLMWWGDPAQPSMVRCSQPSDGANYYGDTGFFLVASDNGQRVTAVFEFRNQIYVAKENSLHLVTPNNGDPATWSIVQISPCTGVSGPRAVQVANDFVFLMHRSGAYLFNGGSLQWVNDELVAAAVDRPGIVERIHWAYDYLIWVNIDHETKCVRVGVPLDGATLCSHILKVSYLDGWDRDIRFSPFTGRYHFFPGRRWSLDSIAAGQGVRIRRTLPEAAFSNDRRRAQSQILLASSGPDGRISFPDADARDDGGIPFAWVIHTGAISATDAVSQQRQGVQLLGMVQVRSRGAGQVLVEDVPDGLPPLAFMRLQLQDVVTGDDRGLALVQGENIGLRFSNAGLPAAFRLLAVYAFVRPQWRLRPGV